MLRFIASRLLQAVVVLFCILSITFFLSRFAPGSPFTEDKAIPAHVKERMEEYAGLNKPLLLQYVLRLKNFATLDFGPSFGNKGFTVNEIIKESLPVSILIGFCGLVIALGVGVPIGVVAAARRNSFFDYSLMTSAMIGICLPTFVLGPLFAMVFGLTLNLLPVAGWNVPSRDWILPSLTMGLFYAGYIARISRAGMLEMLSQDFIRTAKAKGVPGGQILVKHSLKGGLLPVVNYLGPAIAAMIGGSFVMETIFQLPGLGKHFINAISNRDYPLIEGTVAVFAVLILVMNFAADILSGLLNPRLRSASGGEQ